MNEPQKITESNQATSQTNGDIGAGRKTGIYGCAFFILSVIIVFIVLVLTGIYNPFQGTEGVGP